MDPPSQPAGKKPLKKRKMQGADADKTFDELNDVEAESCMDQKMPGEAMPSASKKQKMERTDSKQSIDEMNDVMAACGVDLRDEEEQLFGVNLNKELEKLSGINVKEEIEHSDSDDTEEESGITEAEHKSVQEEEEPLFLETGPLRAKVDAIAAELGLRNFVLSKDAERCLSFAAEERLRSMLYKLIRISKQRCDVEKAEQRVHVTEDHLTPYLSAVADRKAALQKKHHERMEQEYERLRSIESVDQSSMNVATRKALGDFDALFRFEWMEAYGLAERQPILDTISDSTRGGTWHESASSREQEQRHVIGDGPAAGVRPRSKVMKDVVALLERDEKLAKSTLMYKLLLRN